MNLFLPFPQGWDQPAQLLGDFPLGSLVLLPKNRGIEFHCLCLCACMVLCGHMSMYAMLVMYTHVCILVSVNTHHVYMAVQFS